jgi:hypothetical protein
MYPRKAQPSDMVKAGKRIQYLGKELPSHKREAGGAHVYDSKR